MKHVSSTLSGLAFGAAAAMVVAATVHGPTPTAAVDLAAATPTVGVSPAYPHNINPHPHGPFYLNPYAPYAAGEPDDVNPPAIGVNTVPADPQPVHPTEHH